MAAKRRAETMEETRTKLITAARKAFAEKKGLQQHQWMI